MISHISPSWVNLDHVILRLDHKSGNYTFTHSTEDDSYQDTNISNVIVGLSENMFVLKLLLLSVIYLLGICLYT